MTRTKQHEEAPVRRQWAPDRIQEMIATYESLAATGGARARWLHDQNIASAQMSVWRKKYGGTSAAAAAGGPSGKPQGVVAGQSFLTVVDGPDVAVVISQLLAQREKLDRAIEALRALQGPVAVVAASRRRAG